MQMMIKYLTSLLILIGGLAVTGDAERDFSVWESAITAFERGDAETPLAPEGVLFVGSSSIRFWDLEKYFPQCKYINRGFGGSHIIDSVHFADRIILKHRPRTIVFYAGDNDVTGGKSPEHVLRDFRRLVALVHQSLPKTKIAFIAIKPSISRWRLAEPMKAANALIAAECQKEDRLSYVDVWKPMLGNDGKPRGELFVKDGLHLSHAGYQLWTKLVLPHVTEK